MSQFLPRMVIRNPRNLEKLGIAKPPSGYQYEIDRTDKRFIYRVELELSGRHTTGYIRHYTDGFVMQASTREWPIAKRLYSLVDVSAAEAVSTVLAYRCVKAGITQLNSFARDINTDSLKKQIFLEYLTLGGIELINSSEAIIDVDKPESQQSLLL